MVKDLEDAYAQARQAHPAFNGKTVTYCWPIAPDYYAYDDTDPRVQVVLDLGLVLTEEILELKRRKAGPTAGITVGAEELQLLDADLIIAQTYGDQRAEIEKNKLFQAIPAVRRGDVIWLPQRVSDGLAFGTVLSARAILDDLVGLIAARLET